MNSKMGFEFCLVNYTNAEETEVQEKERGAEKQ